MDFQFLIQSFIALLPLSFFTAFWYMLGIRTGEGKREDRITSPWGIVVSVLGVMYVVRYVPWALSL